MNMQITRTPNTYLLLNPYEQVTWYCVRVVPNFLLNAYAGHYIGWRFVLDIIIILQVLFTQHTISLEKHDIWGTESNLYKPEH